MIHFKISLICCTILLVSNHICQAGIIVNDGDFETTAGTAFTLTGTANPDVLTPSVLLNPAFGGTESLQLVGNGDPTGAANFSQAFQDLPVGSAFANGLTINVGDQVVLEGDVGQLSGDPLFSANVAFLEIVFVDSAGAVIFGPQFQSVGINSTSPVDSFQRQATAAAIVPAGASQVRFQAVFDEQSVVSGQNSGGAFFDNLEVVVTVPEPSSGLMLAAGFLAIFARRRR